MRRVQNGRVEVSSAPARKKFQGYMSETPLLIRIADVRGNKGLETLREAFHEYCSILEKEDHREENYVHYKLAFLLLKNRRFSVKNINDFLIVYNDEVKGANHGGKRCSDGEVGQFISGAMSASKARKLKLTTKTLEFKLEDFGIGNTKDIEVDGDVGELAFCNMESGLVEINGNAKEGLGYCMEGGRIILRGDLILSELEMTSNYYFCTGYHMTGGEIHIEGNIVTPYETAEVERLLEEAAEGGKIYHKGKLVVDK